MRGTSTDRSEGSIMRRARCDGPGTFHHVFQRGIAKRPIFETRTDVRFFLSLLAREVRAGTIRLHAFSILTTHFHLLVESVEGSLSPVMRTVLLQFARRFNRERRRDGPLFRGRFGSRPVRSHAYRMRLVRYIDRNAPEARLATVGEEYAYGSAIHYCARRRPPWLETSWVDAQLGSPEADQRSERYRREFGRALLEAEKYEIDRRLTRSLEEADESPDPLLLAPAEVLAWMRRKRRLADGSSGATAMVDADTAEEWARRWPLGAAKTKETPHRRRMAAESVRVGTLRVFSRLSYEEIGRRIRLSPMQVRVRLE